MGASAFVLMVGITGCHHASRLGDPGHVAPQGAAGITPAQQAALNGGVPPYTRADADFMSHMIAHHAQALAMAAWAPTHGASPPVRTLCERITVSQTDEIKYMQGWLADRHLPVPAADPRGAAMPGMEHPMLMPGMLTPEQMQELDRARGPEFDRLFLTDMIAHHRGALEMVQQLVTSPAAAQEEGLFAYATDVQAGQAAEIGRMQHMLADMPASQ